MDDDEIGYGVDILDPLLSRPLDTREQSHVFERNRRVSGQRFQELTLDAREVASQIYKT